MKLFSLTLLIVMMVLSMPTLGLAKDKVVVIPLFGNDAKPIGNVVTVAKENGDYLDVLTAMASIKDASSTNPYLIVIGPGEYAITETLLVKANVSIIGSGEGITELIMRAPNEPTVSYSYSGSSFSQVSLSNLTIRNSVSGANSCLALEFGIFGEANVSNVTLIAEGCSNSNIGLGGACGFGSLKNLTIRAAGGVQAIGITSCGVGGKVAITDSKITSVATNAIGIRSIITEVNIKRSYIETYSSISESIGIKLANSIISFPHQILDSEILADGRGSATITGIEFLEPEGSVRSLLVKHSTISGKTNSIKGDDDAIFKVSHSTLIGSAAGAGNTSLKSCVFTDNDSSEILPTNCVESMN